MECRLKYAHHWAIRCVHESKMHSENSFLTLTYDQENVPEKLQYEDFQAFMKKLRKITNNPLGFFTTGEYGDRTYRPHWHALIFGWYPKDAEYQYSNHRGDQVSTSAQLTKLWGLGNANVGAVTYESASYVARYAIKKLTFGNDNEHVYEPISKKSQKNAIGKKFLERYWQDIFSHGYTVLDDGSRVDIPRYYERWFEKNHPEEWLKYKQTVKAKLIFYADQKAKDEKHLENYINSVRLFEGKTTLQTTKLQAQKIITEQKVKQLNQFKKL